MTAGNNTVSVVIPAYNAARYLAQAIDCALGQTHSPQEVIVVDDGSRDATPEVCKSYGDRIRYVRQENRGEAGARNTAFDLAVGEFIALVDADDLCAPERFARQVAALRADTRAIACFSGHWVFTEQRTTGRYEGIPENAGHNAMDFACSLLVHPITMMFRRVACRGVRFPVGVTTGGDMIFTGLLRRQGRFVVTPDILYGYRRHAEQITAQHTSLDSLRQRLDWLTRNRTAVWPELDLAALERAMWQSMAESLLGHYWARRGDEFRSLRDTLRANWPAHLRRPPELDLRWYPDWLWRCKGWLDSVSHHPRKAPAQTGA